MVWAAEAHFAIEIGLRQTRLQGCLVFGSTQGIDAYRSNTYCGMEAILGLVDGIKRGVLVNQVGR